MGREGRDYWEAQLSEYWDSGLTIQEYSELKELSYESKRPTSPMVRGILRRALEKIRVRRKMMPSGGHRSPTAFIF